MNNRSSNRHDRPNRNAKFTGQLYQLSSTKQLPKGAYVEVNGPWDTYGLVVESTPKPDNTFLNLIRGCKQHIGHIPAASF